MEAEEEAETVTETITGIETAMCADRFNNEFVGRHYLILCC